MTTLRRIFLDSFHRYLLAAAAAIACLSSGPIRAAAPKQHATVSAAPGTVLRWSVPETKSCREGKRSWRPLGDTCYFPIDILRQPGTITLTRVGVGRPESARVNVESYDYGTVEVNLGEIPQRDPSAADLKRNACEVTGVAVSEIHDQDLIKRAMLRATASFMALL